MPSQNQGGSSNIPPFYSQGGGVTQFPPTAQGNGGNLKIKYANFRTKFKGNNDVTQLLQSLLAMLSQQNGGSSGKI